MKLISRKLAQLINVKTLVTFAVTGVFVYMAVTDRSIPEGIMAIITMVIAFYFGTQKQKTDDESA